jgi:hypothetical protein
VLPDAFARHPERFPNGQPKPKAVPTAVWINPPLMSAGRSEVENQVTQESREVAIVDPAASVEVVFTRDQQDRSNLTSEELCMTVAQ